MNKNKLKTSFVFLLGIGLTGLQAQTVIPATGGDATGTGGSTSYTVGQVTYTTNTETGGTVSQGVQQPFEIIVETGIEQQGISLACIVYPNPVTHYLILSIDANVQTMHASSQQQQLSYQLFDTKGQMITTGKVTTAETKVVTDNLIQGNYLLRVVGNNQAIKTFKIVKN